MESKPDSDMLRAGPTQVRFVPVFGSRLLEVLAPVRLVTSETGVALRMLLSASASAPDVILARAFLPPCGREGRLLGAPPQED